MLRLHILSLLNDTSRPYAAPMSATGAAEVDTSGHDKSFHTSASNITVHRAHTILERRRLAASRRFLGRRHHQARPRSAESRRRSAHGNFEMPAA